MTRETRRVCRCGVYADLHPIRGCANVRRSYWWHRHSLLRHAAVRLWWVLPDKARWSLAYAYQRVRSDLCWCDMFDAVWKAGPEWRRDYQGRWSCACDAPLLTDAKRPTGDCYCPVPDRESSR